MSISGTGYGARIGTADTRNMRSPVVWGGIPVAQILSKEAEGYAIVDEFMDTAFTVPTTLANFGRYRAFSSTGGTMNPATAAAGGIVTPGSDGDDEAANISMVQYPFKLAQGQQLFAMEIRVKFDTILDTKYDFFFGLFNGTPSATVPITATAGTLADVNLVGFHRLGTDGDYVDCVYKADGVTAVTQKADAQVLVADTYVKLAVRFDPNYLGTGVAKVVWFANGIELTSYTMPSSAGTDFPNDVQMGLVMGTVNAAGSVTSVPTVDWWAAAQLGG